MRIYQIEKDMENYIPLRDFVSLGLVNLPIKFDTKFMFTLEIDINRNFETNVQAAAITAPDTAILWHDRPSMKYKQIRLDENFCQYFEGIIMPNKNFRTGMQKTPFQKITKSIHLD